jgi:hypothetical protein
MHQTYERHIRSGAKGSRTLDLCIANAALSQLSYRPKSANIDFKSSCRKCLAKRESSTHRGLPPAASRLAGMIISFGEKGPNFFDEVARVGELAINTGKANKGHFVQIAQMFHDEFA